MSVSRNKKAMGFERHCPMCRNCRYVLCNTDRYNDVGIKLATTYRCELGRFAVKPQNYCKFHKYSGKADAMGQEMDGLFSLKTE